MTITTKKAITISIDISDTEKEILRKAYRIVDDIDSVIQDNSSEGDITNFIDGYYADILTFYNCLITEPDVVSRHLSEYLETE